MSAASPKRTSRVTFENEPKLSEHEVDAVFNERRTTLASQIDGLLAGLDRFRDERVSVRFLHSGVSSLVTVLTTEREKSVLKIPLSLVYARGEADFLQVWSRAGVRTPRVYEEGSIGEHQYLLMEYVDAPTLSDAYTADERVERGVYRAMGEMLRRMHGPAAEGYGPVVEGRAQFAQFGAWLEGAGLEERAAYVREQSLLGEEHGSLVGAVETLESYVAKNQVSSYCHDDFDISNIFATSPLTVFDPNPRFNHAYLDLGRTVLMQVSCGIDPAQLITGYFGAESGDDAALQAAVLLNAYLKFPYWHKVKKMPHIERVQRHLAAGR